VNSAMRSDAQKNKVLLALKRAIEATFDEGKWLELGYLTNQIETIERHPRLLKSCHFGDQDYGGNILSILPNILRSKDSSGSWDGNLGIVEDFVGLEDWLRENESVLYAELYGSLIPLSEVADVAGSLDIVEFERHAARIRHVIRSDPGLAIGSAKELLETVLKAVLAEHGPALSKDDIPGLLKRACQKLGLDVQGVNPVTPGADTIRRVLGNLGQIVVGVAEIRNLYGTGHGRAKAGELDLAHARLVVNSAVAVGTFLLQVWQAKKAG
jgi:hypothetical protein